MLARRILGLTFATAVTLLACSGDSGGTSGDPGSSSGSSGGPIMPGTTSSSSGSASSSSGTSGTSGSSGMTSASSGTSGTPDPFAACISSCEAKYPQGVQIGKGIDQCWAKSCPAECNGIGTGQPKPPRTGDCSHPVKTPSADCSQCTVDKCCAAWDACFGNTQCAALNQCSIACYH